MENPNTKQCPYCKEDIHVLAAKCKHCQSALGEAGSTSKAEKLAELVIKTVGIVPMTMTILLVVAGAYGIKTVSDVQAMVKVAQESSDSIKAQSEVYNRLVQHDLEIKINTLLNELSVDSDSSKARSIRRDLKDLLDNLKEVKVGRVENSSAYKMASALFSYYDKDYHKAMTLLEQVEDSPNKFRLLGIVTANMGEKAAQANQPAEFKRLNEQAYHYFYKAETLIEREDCQLINKNRANRATVAAKLGNYQEAENIYKDLIARDEDHLLNYYNIACLYSRWCRFDDAINVLEKGVDKGLAASGELTKKAIAEDSDFSNLRNSTDGRVKQRLASLLKRLK